MDLLIKYFCPFELVSYASGLCLIESMGGRYGSLQRNNAGHMN